MKSALVNLYQTSVENDNTSIVGGKEGGLLVMGWIFRDWIWWHTMGGTFTWSGTRRQIWKNNLGGC
jgi:hypothetical protein